MIFNQFTPSLSDVCISCFKSTGELGMGVTIDKSRGNTIVEGVSIKSVTEGGSAALAKSRRGAGLKLGKHIHDACDHKVSLGYWYL